MHACVEQPATCCRTSAPRTRRATWTPSAQALGEDTICYFGFSYGSELGATWATLFPDTVRAAVLDGAVDPTVGYLQQNIQQAAGFEATFATFLAQCSAAPACAFHNGGDAEGAFDVLAAEIDADPVAVDPDRTAVTQGVLGTAVGAGDVRPELLARSWSRRWPTCRTATAQAILDLYDEYYGYSFGEWDNSLEAYFAIGCLDDPGSTGPDDLFSHEAEFAAAAPRLGRGWMAELTFCSVWPVDPVASGGRSPARVPARSWWWAPPATRPRRCRARATWPQALEDGRLVVVDRRSAHRATA